MDLLALLLVVSIALRFIALIWSATLLLRHRDWRMGTLTAMLGLMAVRQSLTFYTHVRVETGPLAPPHEFLDEIPGVVVSLLALLFVVLLQRTITAQAREADRRLATEQKLGESEQRLRFILEQLPAIVWTTDRSLRFTSSVGLGLAKLGLEPGEVIGKSLYEYFGTDDQDFPSIRAHRRALAGKLVALEQDWADQSFHVMVEPLRDGSGGVVGTLGVALDVTELVASERALRRSEERYRDFLAQTAEGIWRLELAEPMPIGLSEEDQIEQLYRVGSLAECSDAFAKMYGLATASVLVGARLDEIMPRSDPEHRENLRLFIRRGYRLDGAKSSELDALDRRRHFVISLTGIVEKGHLLRVWGTRREVTERVEAELALKASEERYRDLFEASQDTIFISTPGGRIIDINPAGLKLLGYDSKQELLQVDIGNDLYQDPEERRRVVKLLAEQDYCRDHEIGLKTRDGRLIRVLETTTAVRDAAGNVVALRGMLRDVTERRQLEEQLLRSQRMDAVGRLAGGVAHDFNNLLTVINGRSDLLYSLIEPDSPMKTEIDEIKQAGKRAAALTRQLLILSRRPVGSPRPVDLNQVIRNVEILLRRSIGEQIELLSHLAPDLASVRLDPSQIEQVLLNLALNARDAMPQGGTLTIQTENVRVAAGSALSAIGLEAGPHVLLRVEDTGAGIDPSIRGEIFEPFFTTKAPTKGTGLGLSTVYGIVQQSRGQIRVESEPGKGANFEIFLPAFEEVVVSEAAPAETEEAPRGSETILLVEDEAAVRSLLRRFLDTQGYRVVEAADGETALEQAEIRRGEIDLLLTDLVMPGMGGFELARRMESRWPKLKILYMSGYSEHAVGRMDSQPPLDAGRFLQKPFSTDQLARRLRSVLDAA